MAVTAASPEYISRRKTFFTFIYGDVATVETLGDTEAFACIARRTAGTKEWEEDFFRYPQDMDRLLEHIQQFCLTHDLWYSTQLFSRPQRRKQFALLCPTAYSDLDGCPPSKLLVPPSVLVESSPNRYQALWRFTSPVEPHEAEAISRRIAYHHRDDGADVSGWDLTQVLRIPYTHNFKYGTRLGAASLVQVSHAPGTLYDVEAFDAYPKMQVEELTDIPFPDEIPEAAEVLMKYRHDIHPMAYVLYSQQPKDDWSKTLWQLEKLLIESDLQLDEVFAVVREAACNKYERDGRSDKLLWKEVCRAWGVQQEETSKITVSVFDSTTLLSGIEREQIEKQLKATPSFVEEYIEWAKTLGDAAWQYHVAGGFVALSSVLAGAVRLPTSFGVVTPNLWFMILADTTLTRKTTSMDICMDLITDVNDSAVLATDGSIEGIMGGLSMRPGAPSIFLRDEFSGLLESMTKKEYMAGMAELLTKLYDGKYQKRVLKKETIEVKDPVLILFTGGIKNRIFELLNYDQVTSGFLPRFIFITAEADITKIKPVGPPTITATSKRSFLLAWLKDLYEFYNKVEIDGSKITRQSFKAELTPDAWARYNQYEAKLLKLAMESQHSSLLMPTFDRMAKSGLKAAVLLTASKRKSNPVVVTEDDLMHAFYYVDQWLGYSLEVVQNIGKSGFERLLDRLTDAIVREPGIMRGSLMKIFHLSAREADSALTTLEQRGIIKMTKSGKQVRLEINT